MTAPALELAGIRKSFGATIALAGVDFTLRPGELHALLGENGAGKSTLMHIAYGMIRPDAGTIRVRGSVVRIGSPRDARAAGIGMVHQHATAVPSFTVAENVALAAGWVPAPALIAERVREVSGRVGLPLESGVLAGDLSVALKQRLEIVKAIAADATILLLDEPTAVLAPPEAEALLERARAFAREGGSVVLITHRLNEALAHADRVTVLRRGVVTLESANDGLSARQLADAMVGEQAASLLAEAPPVSPGMGERPVSIAAEALEVQSAERTGLAVREVSLTVRAGEIVGVAAVEGNGQRELLRALAGVLAPLRGRVDVAQPVSFIPEDRTIEGLIPSLTLTENMMLGLSDTPGWSEGGRLRWRAARERTAELIPAFGIRAAGAGARAATLSGGNQQKLVLARALERRPAVIIAEDPTRGLDIAAARQIHDRLRAAAAAGAGILVYSSDLDEVLALADRVVVMFGGRVVASLESRVAARDEVGWLMVGSG